MTEETIKKLNELQKNITVLTRATERARANKIVYRVAGYDAYYNLPIELVPGLADELKAWIIDQMSEHLSTLTDQLENLTLCTKSNETRYDPTEI